MSAFDSITTQFKSMGQRLGQSIQESAAYQQAQDRYQNMSPVMQKMSVLFATLAILFIVLFIPTGKILESQTELSLFEEKRNLIRELFRTYRESSAAPNIVMPPNYQGLRSAIDAILMRAELLPEQNLGATDVAIEGRLIPQNLVSNVLQVKLAKLNLKQIVDIGSSIAAISESVKMKDLLISANSQDTRYYDVTYKLYSLKVPEATPELAPEPERNSKNSRGLNQ